MTAENSEINSANPDHTLVSVIIPVYNGEKYIKETIQSVVEQSEPRWEIIVVNDGSTDNSLNILENLQRDLGNRLTLITVENGGVSTARNTGVAASHGKYLAFLDQDDIWAPKKLEEQIHMLDADESVSISFTNESIIDERGTIIKENALSLDDHKRGYILETLLFDNFIPLSSVMMRRDLFDMIGGFKSQYALAEDYDLLLKAAEKRNADFIDKPLLKYRLHKGSGTFRKIDRIRGEAFEIIDSWKIQNPDLFRKNFLKYNLFKLKFYYLKFKLIINVGFS